MFIRNRLQRTANMLKYKKHYKTGGDLDANN